MKKRFFKYGLRPIIEEQNNGLKTYYAYQWTGGDFNEDMSYWLKINHDLSGDAEELTKQEFDAYIAELRKRLEKGIL